MADKQTPQNHDAQKSVNSREERLRQALRANLQKRKAQARGRRAEACDSNDDKPTGHNEKDS